MHDEPKRGTTTLALKCKDGIVMGAERRATMGSHIAHKVTKKTFKIDNNLGMTVAGLVGDAQSLVRWISAEARIHRMKRNKLMSVKSAATLTANILSARRYFPYWVQLIICGMDENGPEIYSLDPAGGSIPDKFVATGSGMMYVYGILEDYYQDDMSIDDGQSLAVRALLIAMKRDAASGDGVDITTISKDGFIELTDEKVNDIKKKIAK